MTQGEQEQAAGPKWLPWVFLGLLVLPFHPLWIDFEQVRRGLLLVMAGGALCALPCLPRPGGAGSGALFIGALALSAVSSWCAEALGPGADGPASFQAWEAAYRIAHWSALLVWMRLGALTRAAAFAAPVAALLLTTSAFGLLQYFGLAEVAGYGVEREPVTTLGNLNVSSEWTAVAAAATVVLTPRSSSRARWLAVTALVFAGAYLVVNPSRSGKVATLGALAALALLHLKDRRWLSVAARGALTLAAGATLGGVALWTAPTAQLAAVASEQTLQRSAVTLQVRFEIADGVADLLTEAPLLGHGPGMFQVEYPRHRNQAEIEASSFGRQFPTEVRHAHNDWLELLVDGGAVTLLLFVWMLSRIARRDSDRELLLPLLTLAMLMFVRAPALNAPAAALAFWLAGANVDLSRPTGRDPARRALSILAGAGMIALGALPIAGNSAATSYLEARRAGAPARSEAIASAAHWMPFEPRWPQLQAQEAMSSGDLPRATEHAERAVSLRPFSPSLLLLHAETLARRSMYGEAIQIARRGLALDPANPELRALCSTALAELGDVDRAILEVAERPHARLRARLADLFAEFATRAEQRGDQRHANRYRIEALFAAFADFESDGSEDAILLLYELNRRLGEELRRFGRDREDLRWMWTSAITAMALGRDEQAAGIATAASERDAALQPWQRALLGVHLEPLRRVPGWRSLLEK